jgi:hypothetical protein
MQGGAIVEIGHRKQDEGYWKSGDFFDSLKLIKLANSHENHPSPSFHAKSLFPNSFPIIIFYCPISAITSPPQKLSFANW